MNKQYTELWTRSTLRSMNHVLQVKKTALNHCASRHDWQGGYGLSHCRATLSIYLLLRTLQLT